jgi:hypothetical protein
MFTTAGRQIAFTFIPAVAMLALDEFVLVAVGHELAWRLKSAWRGSFTSPQRFGHHFVAVPPPTGGKRDVRVAEARFRALLEPLVDHPYQATVGIGGALDILEGAHVDDPAPFGIEPWGVSEDQQRLYWAALHIAAGKLSGMGGFDDFIDVDSRQLVQTFVEALAASTQPS